MRLNMVDEQSGAIEAGLVGMRLDDLLRVAAATACVDAEEEQAAVSSRPTCPVFQGEPWR